MEFTPSPKLLRITNILIGALIAALGSLHSLDSVLPGSSMNFLIGIAGIVIIGLEFVQNHIDWTPVWDPMRIFNFAIGLFGVVLGAVQQSTGVLTPEQIGAVAAIGGFILMLLETVQASIQNPPPPDPPQQPKVLSS